MNPREMLFELLRREGKAHYGGSWVTQFEQVARSRRSRFDASPLHRVPLTRSVCTAGTTARSAKVRLFPSVRNFNPMLRPVS
jgi:hypothetical protein